MRTFTISENKKTGEVEYRDAKTGKVHLPELNEVLNIETRRPDGSLRLSQDFSFCPSMAEQHTGHLSDINYLMERYQPDELVAYLQARGSYRREILGHDFSAELSLQEAKNVALKLKYEFEAMPEEIRKEFPNHVEFLKFIDNPANAKKMLALGLMTQKEINTHTGPHAKPAEQQDPSPSSPSPSSASPDATPKAKA